MLLRYCLTNIPAEIGQGLGGLSLEMHTRKELVGIQSPIFGSREAIEQWIAHSLAVQVARVQFLPSAEAKSSDCFSPSWHKMVGY